MGSPHFLTYGAPLRALRARELRHKCLSERELFRKDDQFGYKQSSLGSTHTTRYICGLAEPTIQCRVWQMKGALRVCADQILVSTSTWSSTRHSPLFFVAVFFFFAYGLIHHKPFLGISRKESKDLRLIVLIHEDWWNYKSSTFSSVI